MARHCFFVLVVLIGTSSLVYGDQFGDGGFDAGEFTPLLKDESVVIDERLLPVSLAEPLFSNPKEARTLASFSKDSADFSEAPPMGNLKVLAEIPYSPPELSRRWLDHLLKKRYRRYRRGKKRKNKKNK